MGIGIGDEWHRDIGGGGGDDDDNDDEGGRMIVESWFTDSHLLAIVDGEDIYNLFLRHLGTSSRKVSASVKESKN